MTNLDLIYNICCSTTGLELNKKTRKREYIYARACYYYFARFHTKNSLSSIGLICGTDHATVLHGIKIYENNIKYPDFYKMSENINKALPDFEILKVKESRKERSYLTSVNDKLKDRILELEEFVRNNEIKNKHIQEINSLPEIELQDFLKYKWQPHKKMLESKVNYPIFN